MYDIERLLINVLVLNVFLLFVPLFLIRVLKIQTKISRNSIFIISACFAVILCLLIPLNVSDGYAIDLHWVALIVGSLYGGILASIFLWLITSIYYLFIEGYGNLIISSVMFAFLLLAIKTFSNIHKNTKLLFGCVFSSVIAVIDILHHNFIQHIYIKPSLGLAYLLIQMITTVIIMYVLEIIKESSYVNRKIIKAEKMEVVSYLASSISHEVKNPLTVIKGFLQMMKQSDLPDGKKREFIEISLKEVDRANEIIVSYLTFAKPTAKKFELLDIKKELLHTINIITPLANMNCVEVSHDIKPSLIKGDPQLFQQCFLNIIKNCIEAMSNSGELIIETNEKRGQLVIDIIDNGRGMTKEQLSRLGEPYFTTKGEAGTGLGMMVVIRIIEILNGKLSVTSEVNKGTQYKISFPIVEKDFLKNA